MASKKVGRGNFGTQTPGGRAGDAMEQVIKDMGNKGKSEGHRAPLARGQEIDRKTSRLPNKGTKIPHIFSAVGTGTASRFNKSKTYGKARNMGGTMDYNMGGTMKNYRDGGVEAADKEGSRLSISMERQEDAGYSPSEADFDQQHRLAAEGIMEVGADVKTIQGHNSRASLGETEGVRGTGAMVKGTKFVGVF